MADKYMEGRNDGMAFALKIAKEQGIEALETECKYRGCTNLPSKVPKKAADEFVKKMKENTIDTILILSGAVLRDEFGFGKKRLERFKERFMLKTECLVEDYCTWDDIKESLKEEVGMELDIRKNG